MIRNKRMNRGQYVQWLLSFCKMPRSVTAGWQHTLIDESCMIHIPIVYTEHKMVATGRCNRMTN